MSKSRAHFIIDAAMLLCGAALAGIGFLMKFVLIPGKERFVVYGRNVDLFFLALTGMNGVHCICGSAFAWQACWQPIFFCTSAG